MEPIYSYKLKHGTPAHKFEISFKDRFLPRRQDMWFVYLLGFFDIGIVALVTHQVFWR